MLCLISSLLYRQRKENTAEWGMWEKTSSQVLIPGAAAAVFALKWKTCRRSGSRACSKDILTHSQSTWLNSQMALNNSYFLHLTLWTQLWAKLTKAFWPILSAAFNTRQRDSSASLNNTVHCSAFNLASELQEGLEQSSYAAHLQLLVYSKCSICSYKVTVS